jgi:hypothetical protein
VDGDVVAVPPGIYAEVMETNDDVQVVKLVSLSSDVKKSVQDWEIPVGMRFAVVDVVVTYDELENDSIPLRKKDRRTD